MSSLRLHLTCVLALCAATAGAGEDVMVFTANQGFLSRIYVMDMDAQVIRYFEYENFRFVGLEVVDNEVYAAEAFAPRLERVDLQTGDLEVIVDDWSLFYFYDAAWDGQYFYVDEWDLNRYDLDGGYDSRASFDEYVLGCAWDGAHFWTLDDENLIKCWDLSGWPAVTHLDANDFAPPSPSCRGLWYDGEHFWTAETGDAPGWIYRFDHAGTVLQQWPEPAFSGWGVCVVRDFVSAAPPAPRLALKGNVPNPFNPRTEIRFTLSHPARVEIGVYDTAGRRVATLFRGDRPAGPHAVSWDATGLPSGAYYYEMRAGDQRATGRMMLVR